MDSIVEPTADKALNAVERCEKRYRDKKKGEMEQAERMKLKFVDGIREKNKVTNPLRLKNFETSKTKPTGAFKFVVQGKKEKKKKKGQHFNRTKHLERRENGLAGEKLDLEAAFSERKKENKMKNEEGRKRAMNVPKLITTLEMTSKQLRKKEKGDERREKAKLRK
jgi:hypothetical protein